ncbi:hypothetical protein CDAR_559301 [Caerostris darwini]|uniref:Uncharacterized protein n=1 Tax=Caerostris darwini TaxID=1538125 RepID=A0AAV4P1W6_9ARAC|nr:hypothetical protein CDAR_559301 [Caerostris darwini]
MVSVLVEEDAACLHCRTEMCDKFRRLGDRGALSSGLEQEKRQLDDITCRLTFNSPPSTFPVRKSTTCSYLSDSWRRIPEFYLGISPPVPEHRVASCLPSAAKSRLRNSFISRK